MKLLKNEWLQLLILVAPFCAAALLWDKLPDRIPTHWNAHGQINDYSGKAFGTLFMPAMNIFIAAVLAAIPFMDPRIRKYDSETRSSTFHVLKIVRLVITFFNACIAFAILAFALHHPFDMNRFIIVAISLLFIVLGNFMGKLRPNYFAGFRTPWTLESKTVWLKTHRLGGHVMVVGGMCMMFAGLLLPPGQSLMWCSVALPIVIALIPAVYSYFCYRAEKNASQNTPA